MQEENRIYSEFFTNTAVAWFAAGLITPVITGFNTKTGLFGGIAAIATIFFLNLATRFAKKK